MTRTRAPRSARWRYRWITMLTLTVFGTVGLVGTAAAHTDLTSSDPAEGSTLTAPPAAIALTFNEPVQNFEPIVALTGPDGQPYPTNPPVVDSAVVRTDIGGLGPAGRYTIAYRVVSVDGHPVTGQVQFDFAPAAPPVTAEPPVPAPLAPASPAAGPATSSTPSSAVPLASPSAALSNNSGAVAPVATTDATQAEVADTAVEQPAGSSGWVWAAIIGALVLVTAAAAVIVRQRRQQTGGE